MRVQVDTGRVPMAVFQGLVLVALLGVWLPPAGAQTPPRVTQVRTIIADYKAYIGIAVAIEGEVTAVNTAGPTRAKYYVLKDASASILVEQASELSWPSGYDRFRLDSTAPYVGQQVRVIGEVGYDKGADPPLFVREQARLRFGAVPEEPTPAPQPTPEIVIIEREVEVLVTPIPTEAPTPIFWPTALPTVVPTSPVTPPWVWVVGGMVVFLIFVLLVVIIVAMARGAKADQAALPPPESVSGTTVKFDAPPPGTLKVLPGRFEVLGDPGVKEIRIFKTKDAVETEVTLGRATGPPYSHIQLKPQTVSAKQAKLIFSSGGYTLINYSPTNPTTVNGEPMGVGDSRRLNEGDKIEMGEVGLVYRAR